MLLCEARGATSFEDLRTVDGFLCPTFKEAAIKRGLLKDDTEPIAALAEAVIVESPKRLRYLYCLYLVHVPLRDPNALWQRYKEHMVEDFAHKNRQVWP